MLEAKLSEAGTLKKLLDGAYLLPTSGEILDT
jgi:hypothetical protein